MASGSLGPFHQTFQAGHCSNSQCQNAHTGAFLHCSAPWASSVLLASFFLVKTSNKAATDISSLPTSQPHRTAAVGSMQAHTANSKPNSTFPTSLTSPVALVTRAIEPNRALCEGVWLISVSCCLLHRIGHHTLELKSATGWGSLSLPSIFHSYNRAETI